MRRLAVIALLAAVAVALVVGTQIQDHAGYFSPVYSPDGRFVYYIAARPGAWLPVSAGSHCRHLPMCLSGAIAFRCGA